MTYHDPDGRLYPQMTRLLPRLTTIFSGIAVRASHGAFPDSLACLAAVGARVDQETAEQMADGPKLGRARRAAVALALQFDTPFVFYGDCDRILHWAEFYPAELAQVATRLSAYDVTILGRSQRAFASHPRMQRDTEEIVNYVFAQVSGHTWDVTAGARGLSRRAAGLIVAECLDDEISNDVSWLLHLQRQGGFASGYIATEGLEFETQDRYAGEVARSGGQAQWLAQLDADPRRWLHRLKIAQMEIEAMLAFVE
jgi:hypothetical protein